MRRAIQFSLGAVLVCVVTALVITQTGLGQQGPNPVCPYLRTDALGFPLNPPYSEYETDAAGSTNVNGLFFDLDAPCCGTVTITDNASGIGQTALAELSGVPATFNPITGTSFCQPPDGDLGGGPNPADSTFLITIVNPFFGQTCPANVNFVVTLEDVNGAVRNCIPPPATPPDTGGGSNFLLLTGTNAN